eukprot:CAMPEP_0117432530 /NCGR_PEP_ID=MMETSP0758-20121206/11997_1 /TAXON_ID=63605 /ORGANISM="Percolomonas cosmopolitus, Strain AE-1 (ATCC 50343)" /LENGTH=167 /DNA_ID=CAMNT_0005222497 /DNA_START=403 /DNA_END=903 /DNA_ORIENTATION=-
MMMSAQFRLDETRKIEEAARERRRAIEEEIKRVEAQRQVMLRRQEEEEEEARAEERRWQREREELDSAVSESLTDSQELLDSFDDNYSVRSSIESQGYSETSSQYSLRISNKLQAARNSRKKKLYTPRYGFDDDHVLTEEHDAPMMKSTSTTPPEDEQQQPQLEQPP